MNAPATSESPAPGVEPSQVRRGGLLPLVSPPEQLPVSSLIVKLAARCNMACDYCYWFRDQTVMAAPKLMSREVEAAFLARLRTHVARHALKEMCLVLHGGEPLLFGKRRFARLCDSFRKLEADTGTSFRLFVTTNGLLIDEEWAALFRYFDVEVTVSLDGPAEVHDRRRPDLAGRPTYERVVAGLLRLREFGYDPGVLVVADPTGSPDALLAHLVDGLGCKEVDVLIPDATHEDEPRDFAPFFVRLFDLWLDSYAARGLRVRLFDAVIRGLCGYWSGVDSIGFGPVSGVTVCTDGSLEAHDVCRIIGDGSTASRVNVLRDDIDAIQTDPLWQEIWTASLNVAMVCRGCEWRHACGGGHISSRWSPSRRFDNPSVYCGSLQTFLSHVWRRIGPTLSYQVASS